MCAALCWMLDGLGSSGLGAVWRSAGDTAIRNRKLLGERILRRMFRGIGWGAGAGRLSEIAAEAQALGTSLLFGLGIVMIGFTRPFEGLR